jgi:hypothetical protein
MPLVARAAAVLVLIALAVSCRAAVDPALALDAQTAVRVKTALINDADLGVRAIEVRVVGGVVELSGRVLTQAEADRAVAFTRTVAGVVDVRSSLQVGAQAVLPQEDQMEGSGALRSGDRSEPQDNPNLFALGGAIGWSTPRTAALKTRVAVSPLVKFGSGRGLGITIGLNWFQAELQSLDGRPEVLTRVQVKPIMAGIGYTIAGERTSLSASVVGGYAWNSLTVTDTGAAAGLPVEVDNSLAWRPGVSIWYDLSRRTALNLTVGHVVTRLRLTVLEEGRLEKRSARGDTTIVHAGIAYKLF